MKKGHFFHGSAFSVLSCINVSYIFSVTEQNAKTYILVSSARQNSLEESAERNIELQLQKTVGRNFKIDFNEEY